jgi:uncharacterized protein (UPF0332 family)
MSRLYYACFYAVSALLKNGIASKTHAGAIKMFGLHFIQNGIIDNELGKFYNIIFGKRQTGDYTDFVTNGSQANLLANFTSWMFLCKDGLNYCVVGSPDHKKISDIYAIMKH